MLNFFDDSGKNPGNSNAPSTTTSTSTSTSTSSNGILTGQIHPGGVWGIDFICTLPPPKGIGGLCVGSWKTFDAEIILIGGWSGQWLGQGQGQSHTDNKQKINIVLRVFISL